MSEKPEALRLAQLIEAGQGDLRLAAELRRLHAENERLHQINQSHEMKLSVRGYELQIEDLKAAHAELHALNVELLEALKVLCESHQRFSGGVWDKARAAIAKAEGA
jgi:hypothetical protein